MFEMPYIKSKKLNEGAFDFSGLLKHLMPILQYSNLVVANLETVFAGKEYGYTDNLYSFNTPDEAVEVLKECKIKLVTTANNHCLDRGVNGLKRTIDVLRQHNIDSTGTYKNPHEHNRSTIHNINGTRYAFMSYTYGTNTLENKVVLSKDEMGYVNLLKPQENDRPQREGNKQSMLFSILSEFSQMIFSSETRMHIKRLLGMQLNVPVVDDNIALNEAYIKKVSRDIEATLIQSDVAFMCLHCGGQFNAMPGKFTKTIVDRIHAAGVKHIVSAHPHVVQHFEYDDLGNDVFYSLGSLNISPSSIYVLHELKPDFSIIPHYYFNKGDLLKITFSIVKVIEGEDNSLCVYPTSILAERLFGNDKANLKKDITFIYNRVMQTTVADVEIKEEYEIKK